VSVAGALRFEAAVARHQADLASLFAAIAADPKAKYFHPHPLDAGEAGLRAGYDGRDYYCLAYLDGVPAAYGMLRGWDEGYAEPSLGLAVAPAYQGRGLGRALTEHLHEVARARGATTVRLKVYSENTGARTLYAKLGYAFEASKPGEELGRLRIAWPRRIGILAQGFVEWNGGVDFVFGIVRALLAAPSASGAEFHVLLPSRPARFWSKAFLKAVEQKTKRLLRGDQGPTKRSDLIAALSRRLEELGPRVRLHFIRHDAAAHREAAEALGLEAALPAMRHLDLGPRCGVVGYVYDFQHVHLPELFSASSRDRRDKMFAEMMGTAKSVIVNAQTIADELRGRHPDTLAQVLSLPFAPSGPEEWLQPRPEIVENLRPNGRYFIISNQFFTHKNHRTAFRAFARLRAIHPDVTLVCTGDTHDSRAPSYYPGLLAELELAGVRDAVHILGLIPKRAQIELLKGAVALVQPTLYEGGPGGGAAFDAIALDVPVLASDIPVNREIDCGDVRFFSPTDDKELAGLMSEALGNAPVRRSPETLLAAGQAKIAAAGEVLWSSLQASKSLV
jgi:glycosyltransferase involved in cell wall biosynthesis